MITRFCIECNALTPWNKAENFKDSPYICEGCHSVKQLKRIADSMEKSE